MGPYRIVGRLGEGGMGRVYLGRSPGGRAVAVKVIHPHFASDREFQRRFTREVEAARRVSGVFTAPVVDADPQGSPPWLATAYIPGVSLHDAVACHGALPTASVLGFGAGVAEALGAIHGAGLVHRDLKPSNVLLASDGPRVIDFGIALASEASALTRTGTTMGSPSFMSPEQVSGDRPVGPASDVFSLGSMMVFAATGEGPFGSGAVHSLLFRIVHQEAATDRVPTELRDILSWCLRKEPDERPSVNDLLTDLTTRLTISPEAATIALHHRGWLPDMLARTILGRIGADLALSDPFAETEILKGIRPSRTLIDDKAHPVAAGRGAGVILSRLREQTEAECAEIVAEARSEASLILAKAARDAQAKREEADALFEETRAKAAQAAADFETNLAKRREQSERDLASRQAKTEKRLREIEDRAELLRLEAEKLRGDAERRARQVVEAAQRQAENLVAGTSARSERYLATDAIAPAGQPAGTLAYGEESSWEVGEPDAEIVEGSGSRTNRGNKRWLRRQ
ncbi:protein kinase [Streptomyces sp. SID7909]|nr:protein kinase [Streptomyces sp. SID7909]